MRELATAETEETLPAAVVHDGHEAECTGGAAVELEAGKPGPRARDRRSEACRLHVKRAIPRLQVKRMDVRMHTRMQKAFMSQLREARGYAELLESMAEEGVRTGAK